MIIKSIHIFFIAVPAALLLSCVSKNDISTAAHEQKADSLLKLMTNEEKLGQLLQKNSGGFTDEDVIAGNVGSILNVVDVDEINRIQKLAVEQSRLGIPVIFARDVIHGFNTIMPIPLGQAASWNPELVKQGAQVAAVEARASGVRWTFAPMIDVSRDPRWGRIAEGFGEDPYLTSVLGVASIDGYQGNDLSHRNSIAACAKHFAAYGAAEGGRDYNTVTLPENELRDVYLPPFKAATEAGVATFMNAFNEINGIPATGHIHLLRNILRSEWNSDAAVVSDWFSIQQMVVHGYAADEKDAALKAITAGVDMEMASMCYQDHLLSLLREGKVDQQIIDDAVRNILALKFKVGLFDDPYTHSLSYPNTLNEKHREISKSLAKESFVLLKNENKTLPLNTDVNSVALIGPLANQPHDQLGTWIFDGNKKHSITPFESLQKFLGYNRLNFAEGMNISRTLTNEGFKDAISAANKSDVILLFLGEESILSGESHCRADISLPGIQNELVEELAKTGKPIIGVIMAGRPLTFEKEAEHMDAILYAWHPGTMAGPALVDVIFGFENPSGKLPITFPRAVGQIPVYYSQKNSGKPATPETWVKMYEIPHEADQLSVGNTNHYLDYGFEPWFPFGFGLSYTTFEYTDLKLSSNDYQLGDSISISINLKNTGEYAGAEVVQLYIRDLVGSRTRPVRELKAFKKVSLLPDESIEIHFNIHTNQLGFYNQNMEYVTEPGQFKLFVGGSSAADLETYFVIKD